MMLLKLQNAQLLAISTINDNVECKHHFKTNVNMEKERGIKIINVDKSTDKNGVLHIVMGRVYGQTIAGTTFKYEALKHKGEFHGKQYYIVRNIETEQRMLICDSELHAL